MDKKAVNFVLEFAKDLQKLLETLEKEYGNMLLYASAYYKKKIQERASELTEDLYDKYKNILDLEIERDEKGTNLIIKNYDDETYPIPNQYLKSIKFYELKDRLKTLIINLEIGDEVWSQFQFELINSFYYSEVPNKPIKLKNLERLRFFITLMYKYPTFNFKYVPLDLKNHKYISKYVRWRKNSSFFTLYNKYIKNQAYFFKRHLNVSIIPNFNHWNLNMCFFDQDQINKLETINCLKYIPIQVFEDNFGKVIGIIALMDNKMIIENLNDVKVKHFTITTNFNIFKTRSKEKISIYPSQPSIFESYVNYLDELTNKTENYSFCKNNSEINLKFDHQKKNALENNEMLNCDLINKFNLKYMRNLSNFEHLYFENLNSSTLSYSNCFSTRLTFPDFNNKERFLMKIKKKKTSKFNLFVQFLKNWSYQSIMYELKNEIIIYGYLLPNFEYYREIIYINELSENLDLNLSFLIYDKDFKHSNLSIYSLPSSDKFDEEQKHWNFPNIEFPISIDKKEELFIEQIKIERKIKEQNL